MNAALDPSCYCSALHSERRNMKWPDPRYIPVLSGSLFAVLLFLTARRCLLQTVGWVGKESIVALTALLIQLSTSHSLKFSLSTFLKSGSVSLFHRFCWHLSSEMVLNQSLSEFSVRIIDVHVSNKLKIVCPPAFGI